MRTAITSGWRLARRELRSGLQGFWIMFFCLALGVAAIAMTGSVSSSLKRGMIEQGRPLLGGDIEFSLIHRRLNLQELAFVNSLGQVSRVASMRAIAVAGDRRTLVEIKAVDGNWPLYGSFRTENQPAGTGRPDLQQRGNLWPAFVEKNLLSRLAIKPGDVVRIGKAAILIADTIDREPDRIADGFVLGPRVLVSHQALAATGLLKPGSLVRWRYRVKLSSPPADLAEISKTANLRFADAGWQIRTRDRAAPGAERFVSRLSFFLTLSGLTSLIIGGAGVANAVANYLKRHEHNIATLKCLGASASIILATYMFEVLAIASLAIATGVIAGVLVPYLATPFLASALPLPVAATIDAKPVLIAAAFGYLVTMAFSLWPLASAMHTPPSRLFRGAPGMQMAHPRKSFIVLIFITLVMMAGLALMVFPDRYITTWYIFGLFAGFALLSLLGVLFKAVASRLPRPENAVLALAISGLYRPGSPAGSIILSLGLGLTLFVTLALIDHSITGELRSSIPAKAPAFFFIDVQDSRLAGFRALAARQPGVVKTTSAPMLRGRVQKLNGKPVDTSRIDPHVRWAFRGDRGLTYSQNIPEGSIVTRGKWWPENYQGPPLVSIVDEIANGAGLSIGDTVTVNVLGRNITARITSFRSVNWDSLRLNFVMVFSPGTLKGAPHTHLVTVTMDKQHEDALLAAVTKNFPAVTAVRIKDALDAVNALLSKLLTAIRSASGLTMATGILVLAGALSSGLGVRTRDAVILKTFGATRRQLVMAFVYEYALTGFATALFAILAGSLAAYGIVSYIMEMSWKFSPLTAIITAILAMSLTVSAGLITTWAALGARPARILRSQ